MPKLTANYSEALEKLIRSGDAPIDGIEVGPWFTPKMIKHFRQELPEWRFQYHASNLISQLRYRPGALNRLREYHSCTQSKWISIHIELLPLHVYLLSKSFGIHLKPPDAEKMKFKFIQLLSRVKHISETPIILENLSSLSAKKYAYAANPEIISEIINASDYGFLLDIAHARIAASYQRKGVRNYLEKLPLGRTKQVHVSGIRMKNGILRDVHESMQAEDYALLTWVLGRCKPQVVTLEYFREIEKLREQLCCLRDIFAG